MAQPNPKVIVSFDHESKALLKKITKALEEGNRSDRMVNVFESQEPEPQDKPEVQSASNLEVQDALLRGGMIMVDVRNLIRVLNDSGLHICKKSE